MDTSASQPSPNGTTATEKKPTVVRASDILRKNQPATVMELDELGHELKGEKEFDWARQIYAEALGRSRRQTPPTDPAIERKLRQQYALCTYKDPDLTAEFRLQLAMKILSDGEDLSTTTDQESLGIVGAIYKSKWEVTALREDLERALGFYDRGYRQGVRKDRGYTAINSAFVLDLLASLEEAAAAPDPSESAKLRRARARQIREEILRELEGKEFETERSEKDLDHDWWFVATLAEAYYGLGSYEQASRCLALPGKANAKEWELEATARQLLKLSRVQGRQEEPGASGGGTPGWAVVRTAFGLSDPAMRALAMGKIGVALSGGGFRAALFHLGVLARLADLDLLRHVDVLSCVSGGSIVGAHYYLELRHLLRHKKDDQIDRADYIACVDKMISAFLHGVQTNIPTRVATNVFKNLRMMLTNYSRTRRAAELYEKQLYSRVQDGDGDSERYLSGLTIQPQSETRSPFKPKAHNWNRAAKVPILILNAATLNTGHTWQFTATWMGEPPSGADSQVDRNFRLRRLWYDRNDTPEWYRRIRLGEAVGASACVPGVFAPIVLRRLYEKDITVRLVDGGVHDNQGIGSLLDQDCTVLLVSDASGQMNSEPNPGQNAASVVLRANSILESRVREAQFKELAARERTGLLQDLMFIHLKEGLDAEAVDWIGCEDKWREKCPEPESKPVTEYGILKSVQKELAGIRTDLDSFTDTEAFALMCSGYKMADHFLPKGVCQLSKTAEEHSWPFLKLLPAISNADDPDAPRVLGQLGVGSRLLFKAWRIVPWLRRLGVALQMIGFLVVLALLVFFLHEFKPWWLLWIGLAVLIGIPVLGFLASWLHLWTTDKLFLHAGR